MINSNGFTNWINGFTMNIAMVNTPIIRVGHGFQRRVQVEISPNVAWALASAPRSKLFCSVSNFTWEAPLRQGRCELQLINRGEKSLTITDGWWLMVISYQWLWLIIIINCDNYQPVVDECWWLWMNKVIHRGWLRLMMNVDNYGSSWSNIG